MITCGAVPALPARIGMSQNRYITASQNFANPLVLYLPVEHSKVSGEDQSA
jgi:hypothetical protein